MTSMSRQAFLAQQAKGLTFEELYVPPEMAPDDLSKHAVHDQLTHGNWANGGSTRTASGVTFTRKKSVDGRLYWASEDTPHGAAAIWAEEPNAEQLERAAQQYLDYAAEPERRAQNLMMADQMFGRASIGQLGKITPLSEEQALEDIKRALNVKERVAFEAMPLDEKRFRLKKAVEELASTIDEGTVSMRVSEDTLDSILFGEVSGDGDILNQHVVGESQGLFDPGRREDVELLQGVPKDTSPINRPKYGFIEDTEKTAIQRHWKEAVGQYGDITLRFKPEVVDWTTVTFGDSLNDELHGVRLSDLRNGSANPERVVASMHHAAFRSFWTGDPTGKKARSIHQSNVPYVEAQIHGSLSLSDVAAVVFDSEYAPWDESVLNTHISHLARQGIPTVVEVYRYDEVANTEGYTTRAVTGFDADGDGWIFEGTDKERRG
jgi:hypothetical protein